MNDCEDPQCKQVHRLLDSLLGLMGHTGSLTAPSAAKSAILVSLIREVQEQKQWRTDALKDAHDTKGELRAEIHDLKHGITAAQFVKYWDGLDFKQHCLLSAQSLLKAASLVE